MAAQGPRIALVTGGNKGIGFGIVRSLCKHLKDSGVVYLAARNEQLGLNAVKALEEEGLHPKYIHLDLQDKESISKARDFIKQNHGGLDILVNNAGFAYKTDATEPFGEQAEVTTEINYTGTLEVCLAFLPILKPHARVSTVSSRAGNLNWVSNESLKEKITSKDLTLEELNKIMSNFVSAAKEGKHKELGYPGSAYGMSKIGATALTSILQRMADQQHPDQDVVFNACCPGYVDTDMTSHKGTKTIEEGADTPTYLALLPPRNGPEHDASIPVGKFVAERQVLDWTKGFTSLV